jgi:hypothetical protein
VGETIHLIAPNRRTETDVFAVLAFAMGLIGLLVLPILFSPLAIVFGMISYYRLKENEHLQGSGLRLVGAILGAVGLFYLLVQLQS